MGEGKTSTLRDAYYSSQADAMEFVDQSESDEIITDLETVLARAREEFKIYPEEEALFSATSRLSTRCRVMREKG